MESGDLIERIQDLNVWKRGTTRAPHKPLLVLYALGRIERGEDRLIPYRKVDEDLRRLLIDFGPPRKSHHPEYPFWRLQNDGIWEMPGEEKLERRKSNTDPRKSELLEKDVRAGFLEEIDARLREDPTLRERVAAEILHEHFPPTLHEDILDAVGLSVEYATRTRRRRDPEFREAVRRAYRYRCAICRYDLKIERKPVGVQACHIQWHAFGGPDTVKNGISLCVLHHKLFDRGALHVTADYRIRVSEYVHGLGPPVERLLGLDGEKAEPPQDPAYRADHEYVEWHEEEVFRAVGEG